jgi:methylglutaconyl-CoA hydratase
MTDHTAPSNGEAGHAAASSSQADAAQITAMQGATDLILVQTADNVRTITLNSPANANALSTGLLAELRAAVDNALADPDVRVIVLTGAGRVFCSGADLKEALTNPAGATGLMAGLLQALWDSPKPLICRVNGSARAGGLGLIAACDISIAPQQATFAFSEVRIGVVPAVISVLCLRRMPSRAAAEYFLTGEVFRAGRAAVIGLLTHAVPEAELDKEIRRYAAMLLRGAPGALAAAKTVLRDVPSASVADGLRRMAELSGAMFAAAEAREGMAAFAAKREPAWVPPAAES